MVKKCDYVAFMYTKNVKYVTFFAVFAVFLTLFRVVLTLHKTQKTIDHQIFLLFLVCYVLSCTLVFGSGCLVFRMFDDWLVA